MEDGLTAAYHNFTNSANKQLEKLAFNISTRKFSVDPFNLFDHTFHPVEAFFQLKLTSLIFIQMRIQI